MSNGATPPTVPGSTQPTTLTQPDPGTEAPYLPEAPVGTALEPTIPEPVQKELTELRALRERVEPLTPLLNEMDGEQLYQHYGIYANMLEERRQQPQQPQQPAPAETPRDPWGDTQDPDPYVKQLEQKLEQVETHLQQVTRNVGVDKVASHADKFFREEFSDLTPEEVKQINDGMGRTFQGYANSESGRTFLQNPQYEAVRALAINQMGPKMLEEVYRRKFERERTNRSLRSTDSYRPVQPGAEEVDYGDSFVSAWEAAGEQVRREGGR